MFCGHGKASLCLQPASTRPRRVMICDSQPRQSTQPENAQCHRAYNTNQVNSGPTRMSRNHSVKDAGGFPERSTRPVVGGGDPTAGGGLRCEDGPVQEAHPSRVRNTLKSVLVSSEPPQSRHIKTESRRSCPEYSLLLPGRQRQSELGTANRS